MAKAGCGLSCNLLTVWYVSLTQVTQLQQAAERTQLSTAAVAAKLAAAHAQVMRPCRPAFLLHRLAVPCTPYRVVLQVWCWIPLCGLAKVLTA